MLAVMKWEALVACTLFLETRLPLSSGLHTVPRKGCFSKLMESVNSWNQPFEHLHVVWLGMKNRIFKETQNPSFPQREHY
jgi:hypothetical protein